MTIFQQFKTAATNPGGYVKLISLSLGKFIGFFFTLVLINVLSLCITIVPIYVKSGGVNKIVKEFIPDFTFENGRLNMENIHYTNDAASVCIYIDTDSDELALNMGRGYQIVLIASGKEVYISNATNENTISAEDLEGLSKEDIVKLVSDERLMTILAVGGIIGLFITFVISLLAQCVFVACIAGFCNTVTFKAKLSFWKLVRVVCYGYALPTVINILGTAMNLHYIAYCSTILVFVYVYFALREIKKSQTEALE